MCFTVTATFMTKMKRRTSTRSIKLPVNVWRYPSLINASRETRSWRFQDAHAIKKIDAMHLCKPAISPAVIIPRITGTRDRSVDFVRSRCVKLILAKRTTGGRGRGDEHNDELPMTNTAIMIYRNCRVGNDYLAARRTEVIPRTSDRN